MTDSTKKSNEVVARIEEVRAKQPGTLKPLHDQQLDFFVLDLVDYSIKSDQASMEAPIFALDAGAKSCGWQSKDGKKSVRVSAGEHGRATQLDKDVLIFCMSQLRAALNAGQPVSSTVRFTGYDYLKATNRKTNGADYQRLRDALRRLHNTLVETNIATGGHVCEDSFHLISNLRIRRTEVPPGSTAMPKMEAIEFDLCPWLYNAVANQEVLTIHRDYFRLGKPLERRLYEIARKHVGNQDTWEISVGDLKDKCGSTAGRLSTFRDGLKKAITENRLPEYGMVFVQATDSVVFFNRKTSQKTTVIHKLTKK